MVLYGALSYILSTMVFLQGIILFSGVVCALETEERANFTEDNSKEPAETKPEILTPEELKHFGHLGKLGEQGEILRGQIDELEFFPNGKDFYEHFVRKRKPLVMKGVAKQWPAFEHWKNESYMRERYGDVLFEVDFTKTYEQKFPIKKTLKLNEFFDIYKTQEVYLDSAFPQSNLTKEIPVPYCLQCEELSSKIASIHLLYSSGETSYVLHQDGYENLLTVLSGTKVLLVTNSSYSSRLHSDEFLTVPGLSPIDPEKVDLKKYPRIAGVPFHEVVLEAGDVLYNPQLWWHQVRSYNSPNIGISLWFSQFKVKLDEEDDTPDLKIEEVAKHGELFEEAVETFPKTIACRNQNQPLGSFYWPSSSEWNTPSLDKYKMGMRKLKLPSGYEIPLLGFGTGFLTDSARISTLTALNTGYRLIDTAVAYKNEKAIGEAIILSGVPRDEVFIVDKIHPQDIYIEGATIKAVDQSLEKLKVDYIDVMMLHAKDCEEDGGRLSCDKGTSTRTWEDAWKELETTVVQGKVRSIGVSNFEVSDLERLMEIAEIKPSLVQNLFDPFIQDMEVREFCQTNNIVYMGYSTLGRSWEDIGFDHNPVSNNSVLLRIAAKYDASVFQVVLRWAIWENVVTIPRSSDPKHIALNFASQFVPLNEQDIEFIRGLQGLIAEDEITEAIEKSYPAEKSGSDDKANIIENPRIVVEREVTPEHIALYFGSDDHWIYALDGANGQLLWKHQTADETGSVCMTSNDGSAVYCGADDNYMRAFHTNNGSLIWKFKAGGSVTSSVRVSDSGDLLFGSLDNYFYCVSSAGTLRWKQDIGHPVWATPAFVGGGRLVFVGGLSDKSGTGSVFGLHGETGDVIWSAVIGGIFGSPAVDEKRSIVVFCTVESTCYGMSVDNGEQLWKIEVQSEVYASPTIQRQSGLVFITCLEGTLYAVHIENGVTEWKKSVFIPEIRSTPLVLDDGRMFLASGGGMVLSLNSSNGDVIWSKKVDDIEIFSSPKIATNNMLYVGCVAGPMVALNATTGGIIWKFNTEGAIVATVRISSNHVMYTAPRQQFNE